MESNRRPRDDDHRLRYLPRQSLANIAVAYFGILASAYLSSASHSVACHCAMAAEMLAPIILAIWRIGGSEAMLEIG